MEEAGVEVITAEVKGGDAGVTMTNETACQVAWLQKIILFFLLVQVEILGMLTALTADITEQAHGIDPWDSSGDTKCKKITTVHFTLFSFINLQQKILGLADSATYMAKTDEVVTVNISTETGKPISYRVKQRFLTLRLSNIYIALISQIRFIGTMARWPTRMTLKPIHFGSPTPTLMWVQRCYIITYLATFQPGKYNINVTAYNLHSNELYGYNKFINNMTRWGQWTIFYIFFFVFPGLCWFRSL